MRIAVFDLDGTITRRDTLLPFIVGWLRRRPLSLLKLVLLIPALLAFVLSRDRGRLKERVIRTALGGAGRAELGRWADEFVADTVAHGAFPDALAAIADHKRAGDRLVLLSASVDLYVPRIAAALGFQDVICTRVRWRGEVLDGSLATPNCRAEEKARQLRELIARAPTATITAYGNTTSDIAHLKLATRGVFVNGSPRTQAMVKRLGIECRRWR